MRARDSERLRAGFRPLKCVSYDKMVTRVTAGTEWRLEWSRKVFEDLFTGDHVNFDSIRSPDDLYELLIVLIDIIKSCKHRRHRHDPLEILRGAREILVQFLGEGTVPITARETDALFADLERNLPNLEDEARAVYLTSFQEAIKSCLPQSRRKHSRGP